MANEKRLIDSFESICKKCDHYLVCKYVDDETAECSQYKAPTVDAVPVVHGRWLEGTKSFRSGTIFAGYCCSLCNEFSARNSNYCHNCGADMRGRSAGE